MEKELDTGNENSIQSPKRGRKAKPATSSKPGSKPKGPSDLSTKGRKPGQPEPSTLNEALSVKSDVPEEFSDLLGALENVNPQLGKGSLKILWKGIDTNLGDHPVIKKVPLVFRWRKKEDNVKNGDNITNKGYVVLSKKRVSAHKLPLTVLKDDSPEEDFYSVGDLILCYASKEDYIRRKKLDVVKNTLRPKEIKDKRNEFARAQAKNSLDNAKRNYGAANMADSEKMPSGLKLPDDPDQAIIAAAQIAGEGDTLDEF